MDKLMREILNDSKKNKKIIGIRIYDNDDFFYSGYVLDFNENVFVLKHFTEYGFDDGIVVEEVDSIENIEFNESYYESLQYLIVLNEQIVKSNICDIEFKINGDWKFDILNEFVNKQIIIAIENNKKEKICGFIKKVTESELLMNPIGQLGVDEGLSHYKLADICSIQPDDNECKKRLLLYHWRMKNNKTSG